MFTLSLSTSTIICKRNKFRKFGKRMAQKTKKDLSKVTETLKKLSDDEIKRAKELYRDHRTFIKPKKQEEKIDFYDV